MRLRELTLDMFGHFAGRRFDFGAAPEGGPDFHIIHGPNEAGKTTTMEAYLRLLYGFRPRGEPYEFRHGRAALKVSAVLEEGGQARAFSRVPGRSGTLLDGSGAALTEGALAGMLGGLDETAYRSLLCLDDATIESGGEEIVRAQGEIGTLLFSAAAGIGGLSTVLDGVREEADALYPPRRSTSAFARVRKEIKGISERIREIDIQAPALKGLRKALSEAEAGEARLSAARQVALAERAGLRAAADALPLLAELDRLQVELDARPGWPSSPGAGAEELAAMTAREARAEAERARLSVAVAAAEEVLAAGEPDPRHLALAAPLAGLKELASREIGAARDLPRREDRLAALTADLQQALAELGIAAEGDPGRLVPDADALAALDAAFRSRSDARKEAAAAAREAEAQAQRHAAAGAELAQFAARPVPGADLSAIFARYALDDLVPRHATAAAETRAARREAAAALDALALRGRRVPLPEVLPLSSSEAEAKLRALQAAEQAASAAEAALAERRGAAAEVAARIAALGGDAGLVGDREAAELRGTRDRLWDLHLRALDRTTAEDFAAALAADDRAQAARLGRAADLGALRHLEQSLAAERARLELAGAEAAAHAAAREAARELLAQAADDAGPGRDMDPAALPGWLRLAEDAAAKAAAAERIAAEHAPVFDLAGRLMAELAQYLPREAPDFGEVLAAAKALDTAWQAHDGEAAALRRAHGAAQRELAARQAALAAAEAESSRCDAAWEALLEAQFGGRLASGALDVSLQPLNALARIGLERAQVAEQARKMREDSARFAAALADLAEPLGIPDAAPLERHAALSARLAEAEKAAEAHAALVQALEGDRAALGAAGRELDAIARTVEDLGRAFPEDVPVGTLGELRQAVAEAAALERTRRDAAALEQRICTGLGAADAAEARASLAGRSLPELEAALGAAEAGLETLEAEYRAAIEARTRAAGELQAVTGDAEVALLAERRAVLELELEQAGLRHLQLDLGHRLAEEAIRRYRDRHRGGMMEATEAAFAELTNGGYPRLETRREGQAEKLIAVDSAGTAREAQDMSKGTRFQLYLALRAAAHAQLVSQGTCLPFFCDDIFETFDEDRTRAACRLMARIGRSGQAIYLTHHRHVVDIARETCGDGVAVHALDPARLA
ncbi:YhaN family protein [Mangrovicoccus sp. HB161399]|uniref:YhaN family protein n=1 Tax=Mangrovicoccus sp. HB161399 TaxID=2720392 RepID=UPI001554F1C6|nr:YhaN family protein [Mangrovicoccus sp. HB161399]